MKTCTFTESLHSLSKEELIQQTKHLVAEEIKLDVLFLEHLHEIEFRKLYLEMGYSSLWSFCIENLGMSEASTQRRIASMRLVKEIPEVKEAIENGDLNLSTVAQLKSQFDYEKKNQNPLSVEEKKDILNQVKGLSQKQVEQKLHEIFPETAPREKARIINPEMVELKIVLPQEALEKLKTLQAIHAHLFPKSTLGELVGYLADQELKAVEKKKGRVYRKGDAQEGTGPKVETEFNKFYLTTSAAEDEIKKSDISTQATESEPSIQKTMTRKVIPIAIRRQIEARAQGQCEWVSSEGRRCTSCYGLQYDHILSVAHGGGNEAENIQILCSQHNLYKAQLQLGREVMDYYWG